MGTGGRICEVCTEFTSLLQSYDGKRGSTQLTKIEDVIISREEVETIFLYLQSWTQRQCSCCFRDHKNFERFNWALQVLILIVVEIIKRIGGGENNKDEDQDVEGEGSSNSNKRAVWEIEDKDKLIHFVAKIFLNSFPTYVAYKQFMGGKNNSEEITPQEVQQLGKFCEINEPEASPYLFRNVGLFCSLKGMELITEALQNNGPETLMLHQVNILVTLATNVKAWMNFISLLNLYVPLRGAALGYMCKLVETELKTASSRNMAEYIWSAVKDPVDAHLHFDKDGLDLAFRYFLCPTLTMRLAGVNQINNYINLFNEMLNADHIRDPDTLYENLCRWLLDNKIVEHIFGPNLHVEVIKQSHTILSFLAMENQFTNEHVEVIWSAAQLKHCSKQVFDILSSLICHMEPGPVLHLHNLLKQLEPKDHSEQSLYLASALLKFIWTNAASALEEHQGLGGGTPSSIGPSPVRGTVGSIIPTSSDSNSPVRRRRRVRGNGSSNSKKGRQPLVEDPDSIMSSSENSVSVGSGSGASHSEDEENNGGGNVNVRRTLRSAVVGHQQVLKVKPPLGSGGTGSDLSSSGVGVGVADSPFPIPSSYFKPTCHLSSGSESALTDDDDDDEVEDEDDDDEEEEEDEDDELSISGPQEKSLVTDADGDLLLSQNQGGSGSTGGGASYVETHSDSDTDEEHDPDHSPGENEIEGRKRTLKKRKVLRRKKRRVVGVIAASTPNKGQDLGLLKNKLRKVPSKQQKELNTSQSDNPNSSGDLKPSDLLSATCLLEEGDESEETGREAISQLGSMVEMHGGHPVPVQTPEIITTQPILPEFSTDLLDGSDGSYSSRMSNKSDKNMADFDGEEDSPCDEDLVQSLSQNQLIEMAAANRKVRNTSGVSQGGASVGGCSVLLPPRAMRMFFRRKRFQSAAASSSFNFNIDTVCLPGQTLLWDLIQDDKIAQLSEGLAVEAQKALTNLLCYGADKLIRYKFIEGCLSNIEKNESVVVSLRLLPKLLTSFNNQLRGLNTSGLSGSGGVGGGLSSSSLMLGADHIHAVTLWAEREHKMLEKFFKNLHHLKDLLEPPPPQPHPPPSPSPLHNSSTTSSTSSKSPFPYYHHVQARLEFLTSVFCGITSPDDFRLTVTQVDELWENLATDPKCSDEFFMWLTGQVRSRDQHALSHDTFRHILIKKLPSLPPETVTMHSLTLFQQLCNLARLAVLQDVDVTSSGMPVSSMDYLWKIALYAHSTEVSMTAIQYLNNYYIGRQLDKEEEFVQRCMQHLHEATEELDQNMNSESTLLRIQRGLLLLKSHLEIFRRRFAYHLRKWALDGKGVGSHAQLVGDKGAVPIRLTVQPANFNEKTVLEMVSTDYVADLRAEVTRWWEDIQGSKKDAAILEKSSSSNSSTPVLGSLLSDGPIRIITQGLEVSHELDEKTLAEVPIKDSQLVYVSVGASRPQKKRNNTNEIVNESSYSSYSLPTPVREKVPVLLLLQKQYFEQLFSLMHSLAEMKPGSSSSGSGPSNPLAHTKAQMLSRRVWDILMLLPTNPEILQGFRNIKKEDAKIDFKILLDPSSPQKLIYALYIVESLVKQKEKEKDHKEEELQLLENKKRSWKQNFVEKGGLRHLFDIFVSGVLEPDQGQGLDKDKDNNSSSWSEWKQDGLASLLKILCYLGVVQEETEYLNDLLYDVTETPKKRIKRRKGSDQTGAQGRTFIPRLNEVMLSAMDLDKVMVRLTSILHACALHSGNFYKTGFWGRAQVVHYAMALLVCWAFSQERVRSVLYSQKEFSNFLRKLVLEDPEPVVRREICMGLYRLCLGISTQGKTGIGFVPELIAHLLKSMKTALSIRWNYGGLQHPHPAFSPLGSPHQGTLILPNLNMGGITLLSPFEDSLGGKEPFGPASRDYFWLLCRLLESLDEGFIRSSIEHPETSVINLDQLAIDLKDGIISRDYLEMRHGTIVDDGLVGLLNAMVVVMKHNPPFKSSREGNLFLSQVFDCIFALPSPQQRYLPKCKSQLARGAAYDLLTEMARCAPENYFLLQSLLIEQHQRCPLSTQYPWDYWPLEDGRAPCGYVGLTNLGATCYMASCMQHLYMMPQARASILSSNPDLPTANPNHVETLKELQRMFAYLLESERKAFNPRNFCKVYQMNNRPLNTGEQKDMAEFFIDLVSKLEEMTPELKKLVKTLFCGVTSNNVVSLDCNHVSRTLEEFYTVRCQVADMRNLYESLDEVTVKDTLEGDNMYTCSTCGKKVRAEKRACFKKLPKILCFNTMRYTFNMITMMKEKVNTHFSFPLQLDMAGYVEKTLMPQQYQEEKEKEKVIIKEDDNKESEEESCVYDLIGVTVHTGTADGGHYYCFIRDRIPPNKDKWYLFNDAEVKQFDPSQLPSECFGGEMNTKTYDSVTEKFMDFSFEKTNSAYMLFYERARVVPQQQQMVQVPQQSPQLQNHQLHQMQMEQQLFSLNNPGVGGGVMSMSIPPMTIPVSQGSPITGVEAIPTFELNKELEEWIWKDNMEFLRDKNVFEHNYFNFMSQVCCQIPPTVQQGGGGEEAALLTAKLTATFLLETLIHAKEKPTFVQWMDFLTKQLILNNTAAAWFLDHMASEDNTWLSQILLKCPNQLVRQLFVRLCFHVVQALRPQQVVLYMRGPDDGGKVIRYPDEVQDLEGFGMFSCVTKFIKKYISLLDPSAKSSLKYLSDYFTFLNDFTKLGDEECLLLLNLQTISKFVSFYLGGGSKKENSNSNQQEEGGATSGSAEGGSASEEDEEEEEIISVPTEKNKVVSLERMIALIANLVEKSRDEGLGSTGGTLRLSKSCRESLISSQEKKKSGGVHFQLFPFILQQIRDNINLNATRNLIYALTRWNDKLAEDIIIAIFQAIQKHPDVCHPYFKILNLLAEISAGGPPGFPKFAELILTRILEVSEICPFPTLEWLGAQVPRNKAVHQWCLSAMGTWVEHFLLSNSNQRVRSAAASLLVSLVPHQQFRQGYRGPKAYSMSMHHHHHHQPREQLSISGDALQILHEIYDRLLKLLKPARHYTDVNSHGTSKLIAYFNVMTYFTVSKTEKLLFSPHFIDLWSLFHPRLSEPSIPCHHNKAALLTFWHHVCTDCPENVQRIVANPTIVKQIGFNYILADHEDQEVVLFNRGMLPAYYGILRMCCQQSRPFALALARHQNITWAFKNISPFQTQYPAAVEELFKLMQIIVQKSSDAGDTEITEIQLFKRNTLQLYMSCLDGRSYWGTIISAFRILIETFEDRIFVVMNNGLNLLFEAICMLHTMHHEATACNVVGELVELLNLVTENLRVFRPKEFAHGMQTMPNGEIAIQRVIANCKEWPEVLKKLATLLNTYNCSELRNSALDCLVEFLYTMPLDTLRTLVPLMVHWHTACQDAQTSGMGPTLGPYFPKRSTTSSSSSSMALKSSVRPPRPMLQMAFPHLGQETAKGLDEEYDRQLQEFYGQYHLFVDLMCRVAFMKDAVNQELITLSAMLGYEAAPLHFIHFPKLWLEVYNTPSIDRKHIMMLVNTNCFTDYVELVILEERTCLTNIVIFNFLATYLPKVFDQIATTTDQMCKLLMSIKLDLQNFVEKEIKDVESHAMGILGDLKALSLFYLPTINGKGGSSTNPLPPPAPSVPQLLVALKQLNTYLEKLMNNLSVVVKVEDKEDKPGGSSSSDASSTTPELPSKKRKLDDKPHHQSTTKPAPETDKIKDEKKDKDEEDKPQQSSSQSSLNLENEKRSITRDLIMLLLGTIDNLIRGISPSTGGGGEEMMVDEDDDDQEDGTKNNNKEGGESNKDGSSSSSSANANSQQQPHPQPK